MPGPEAISPHALRDAEHYVLETVQSEHVHLDADPAEPEVEPRRVIERLELRDRLRGTVLELLLYDNDTVTLVRRRRRSRSKKHTIKLRYLDPAPTVTRRLAMHAAYAAVGFAAVAAAAALLGLIEALAGVAHAAAAASGVGALLASAWFFARSHENVVFFTMHGRAPALTLRFGFGRRRRCRALLPVLIKAIENSGDRIGEDTAMYLRQEMREHYRLRADGVLSTEACSESTGRILAQFDNTFSG